MGMLKNALDSFCPPRRRAARAVIRKDDVLDEKNKSIIRELLTYMAESPSLISYSLESFRCRRTWSGSAISRRTSPRTRSTSPRPSS